ncbi:MAG TPA: tetratricopeptide repeat protein [Anaeromyxobacteraceae bacterium]|nr:tetratricopeptide repeat protein [Anaeromyxobacteraceae bacterium]
MRVACPHCRAEYNVDERRIPIAGLNVKCPKCQKAFPVRKTAQGGGGQASTAVPLPAPEGRPAGAKPPAAPGPVAPEPAPRPSPPAAAAIAPPPPRSTAPPVTRAPPPAPKPASLADDAAIPLPPPRAPPPAAPPAPKPVATPEAAIASPPPSAFPPPAAMASPPAAAGPGTTELPDRFTPPFDPAGPPGEEGAVPLPAPDGSSAAPRPLGFGEVSFEEPPAPFAPAPAPMPPASPARGPPPPPPPAPPEAAKDDWGLEAEVNLGAQTTAATPDAPPELEEEPAAPLPPARAVQRAPPPAAPPPVAPRSAAPRSAAPPSGLGPADEQELEMLFGDVAPAGKPAAPPDLRVRRRSGKVFGPFQLAQIVAMLGKGELAGNEEVSPDGERWSPITSVPELADFIRKMNEPVSAPRPAASGGPPAAARPAAPVPFGSRMAAAKVVAPDTASRRPRWVLPAAAGALLLLAIAGAGTAGVLTGHGVFFHRLLRSRGGERPGARLLAEAKAAFARDHAAGLNQALELADEALRLDPDDARAEAVYAQAAGFLTTRGVSPEATLARARQLAALAVKEDPASPDALKAAVAVALPGPADALKAAVAPLQAAAQKGPFDEDAAVLLALAALVRGDPAGAMGWLDKAEAARPGAARLAHLRGLTALRQGGDAAARDHFARALEKDPGHLSSALELGGIAERAGDLEKAEALARSLLAPEAKGLASPAERARAHLVLAAVARSRPGQPEARLEAAVRELEAAVQEDASCIPARLELARFLLRRGAADKAAALLAAAGPAGQADPQAVALQARALVLSGRALDAQNLVDAGLARSPGSAPLLYVKGFIREQLGKAAEAERLYRDAAAKAPDDWEPQLGLGRLALKAKDLDKAVAALKVAAEKGPRQGEVQVGLGDLELARKNGPAAEARYRQALALDPGSAQARYGLARVALARGDEAAAAAELDRALALDPQLAPALLSLATLQWGRGDLAGARKSLESTASLDPRNAVARARLGAVELESGHVEAALAHLEAAVNLDGALAEARSWLGRALLAKGEVARAVEELRMAVRLEPDSADHHLWLGTAYERANSPAEAEEEYRAAQARDPRRTDGYERVAALKAAQGRCQEGIPDLEKALKVAPRQQQLRVAVGDCLERLGKHTEAIRIYREALKADPKQKSLYYRIARSIHERGSGRDALAWYERAAREEPQNAMSFYYLGYLYKERGQRQKALQAFRTYLKLKPEAEERKDVRQEIEDLGG